MDPPTTFSRLRQAFRDTIPHVTGTVRDCSLDFTVLIRIAAWPQVRGLAEPPLQSPSYTLIESLHVARNRLPMLRDKIQRDWSLNLPGDGFHPEILRALHSYDFPQICSELAEVGTQLPPSASDDILRDIARTDPLLHVNLLRLLELGDDPIAKLNVRSLRDIYSPSAQCTGIRFAFDLVQGTICVRGYFI